MKTARYTFDCPLVVGAILAGADQKDINRLSELGILVGQAFQIQDDIIGIFGSQKNIGKSILSDLAETKKTLLVCHAYKKLRGNKQKLFMKYFNKPKKTYSDLVAVRKIFINAGSLHYSLLEIQTRINKALKILEKLKMNDKYRTIIKSAILPLFKQSNLIAEHNLIEIELC